jgi:hypothetical protein
MSRSPYGWQEKGDEMKVKSQRKRMGGKRFKYLLFTGIFITTKLNRRG